MPFSSLSIGCTRRTFVGTRTTLDRLGGAEATVAISRLLLPLGGLVAGDERLDDVRVKVFCFRCGNGRVTADGLASKREREVL